MREGRFAIRMKEAKSGDLIRIACMHIRMRLYASPVPNLAQMQHWLRIEESGTG